jgi:hypothetical protein
MNEIKDLDMLLEIAETNLEKPDVKHKDTFNEATRFVMSNDVEAGDTRIPSIAMWDAYVRWKKDIDEEINVKEMDFYKQFAKIFPRKMSGGYSYYLLNPKNFDLSEDNLARLRKEKIYAKAQTKKEENTIRKIKKIDKELNRKEEEKTDVKTK